MIKRTYFFRVESVPQKRQQRLEQGKPVIATGFISYRSWRSDPDEVRRQLLHRATTQDCVFAPGEVILTALSRV